MLPLCFTIVWIYVVQFKLYHTINRLYRQEGLQEPLIVWWILIPGLNLLVGLRQIHFLSKFWAMKRREEVADPIADNIPLLFSSTA
ncbi:MAG: hypothetical protein ACFE0I_03965 [Elainellaceae cyanobacterium]